MDATITVKMQVADQEVLDSIHTVLSNTLPYMGDNVEITVEEEA